MLRLVAVLLFIHGCSSSSSCNNPCGGACCNSDQSCVSNVCLSTASLCSPSVPTGACSTGETCLDGSCCPAPCGTVCCSFGDTCVSGSCCANPCGTSCCTGNALCIQDGAGNSTCANTCATNHDCTGSAACCGQLPTGGGACLPAGMFKNPCLCATGADCSRIPGSPACVPIVKNDLVVNRDQVCGANDGHAWKGCNGNLLCDPGYDCWSDGGGNHICVHSCDNNSSCGNPGIACCNTSATCSNVTGTCGGSGGCMACP